MDIAIFEGASPLLMQAFIFLLMGSIVKFFIRLFEVRRRMKGLKKQGLSVTPYNPLFGSLLVTKDRVATLPYDANNWPYVPPVLIVASPLTAYQVTQEHSLPKFSGLRRFMQPIAGEFDLVTVEGQMWKKWRGIFNPGFSAAHLMSLVPDMIVEVGVFCAILREKMEEKTIFPMKRLTDNLTMDILGRMVLDTAFNSQRMNNPLVSALRRQIPWLSFGTELNIWRRWHPIRPLMHWYNTRIMDRYITQQLEDRFVVQMDETSKKSENSAANIIDPAYKSLLTQIKVFLFSGHDTTSSSMCYVFHNLSEHPSELRRVRAEHDAIFTTDIAAAPSLISQDPHLINKLPFTLAVIKETLRLFPAASSTRASETGYSVVSEDGKSYPTDGCLVWSSHESIQRDPNFWPSPDSFIPDRWLAQPGDPMYPYSKLKRFPAAGTQSLNICYFRKRFPGCFDP
ncbi:hypothetical protein MMC31_003517 [Peltigera leucophlebia]|nr:hypothetical protein [Peltigera leucophlebia]